MFNQFYHDLMQVHKEVFHQTFAPTSVHFGPKSLTSQKLEHSIVTLEQPDVVASAKNHGFLNPKSPRRFDVEKVDEELLDFLKSLNLEELYAGLATEAIEKEMLAECQSEEQLEELGISKKGHRLKILRHNAGNHASEKGSTEPISCKGPPGKSEPPGPKGRKGPNYPKGPIGGASPVQLTAHGKVLSQEEEGPFDEPLKPRDYRHLPMEATNGKSLAEVYQRISEENKKKETEQADVYRKISEDNECQ